MIISGAGRSVNGIMESSSSERPTLLRHEAIMKMLNQASLMPRAAYSGSVPRTTSDA